MILFLYPEQPAFIVEPIDVDALEGDNTLMVCVAEGVPEPDIGWLKNGLEMPLTGPRHMAKFNMLMMYHLDLEDGGSFVCRAKNVVGVVYSKPAVMTVSRQEPRKE